jgi:Methyltransferase domain
MFVSDPEKDYVASPSRTKFSAEPVREFTQTSEPVRNPTWPKRMTQISSNRGFLDRMVLRSRRLGFTDIFHANVQRRRALGKSFIYVFGTPHLGVFANGLYLKKALKDRQVTSVLDAGCGDGSFTFYVASHFPQARVTGVDIGEQGLHGVDSTPMSAERFIRKFRLLIFISRSWIFASSRPRTLLISSTLLMSWSTSGKIGWSWKTFTGRCSQTDYFYFESRTVSSGAS